MKKQALARVSPWLLAAAGALLALIITVFAMSNYQREKTLMSDALLQQSLTMIRFVASSSRASMRGSLGNIRMAGLHWTDHVQNAIDSSTDQPGLRFLGLIDEQGRILAGSDEERVGDVVEDSTLSFASGVGDDEEGERLYRYRKVESNEKGVFQVVASFYPVGRGQFVPQRFGRGMMRHFQRDSTGTNHRALSRDIIEQLRNLRHQQFFMLVELDLEAYNTAVRRQLYQVISLSLVLLLVGIGGWLSLLTLQGFKGSQVRLRQIREYTDLLVASLPIGLVATGEDGNIRVYNRSAEEMVGIPAADVLGNPPENVLPEELALELRQVGGGEGPPEQKEVTCRRSDGKEISVVVVGLPVVDVDKRYAGNTLLIQDISRLKNLQKELRRNERLAALGKMAAGVAHELRNPLSSIKGLALLLKSKVRSDEQGANTADVLVQEVERLNRSIGELLDYARPHTLRRERINMQEILEKAVTLLAADLKSGGVELRRHYENDLNVLGDRDKLNQVFLNLLLNSLQAMEAGGILKISTALENGRVVCELEDTGCGLDEENIARVFDPYFTTKSDGTGLGLAMSAKIIEEHGGSIEFHSREGQGTVVKVLLAPYSKGN